MNMNPFATGVLTLLSCTEKTQSTCSWGLPMQGINPWRHYKLPINWCIKISAKDRYQLEDSRSDVFFKLVFWICLVDTLAEYRYMVSLQLQWVHWVFSSHQAVRIFPMRICPCFLCPLLETWGHWNSVRLVPVDHFNASINRFMYMQYKRAMLMAYHSILMPLIGKDMLQLFRGHK